MSDRSTSTSTSTEPHPVAYDDLIAYAAGESPKPASPTVAAHLADCPACAATVERYRLIQATVQTDAVVAPSAAALARARALASGLRRASPAPRPSPFASVRRLIAALVADGSSQVARAGLRGGFDGHQLVYAIEGIEVDLDLSPDLGVRHGGARWQVLGQVGGTTAATGAAVGLARPGDFQPLAEATIDEDGMFTFSADAGTYDLLLDLPEGLLVLPRLVIGDAETP